MKTERGRFFFMLTMFRFIMITNDADDDQYQHDVNNKESFSKSMDLNE